ncbi:hypothetical protein CK203_109474 [Vitis vinifera]|uniref:Uncharacterized protein n=1 Tax=Vitis vinifera TaxID=29760 RepID=A0A438DQI8_VITVI|nr:hypothetical protein CK203_109474 [Vitis vinifera]
MLSNCGPFFYPFTEVISGDKEEFLWAGAAGRGPTMSMPHCAKGHGPETDFNAADGIWIVLPYDFRIFLHVIQLAHTGPLNAQDSEDKALEAAMPAKRQRALSARLIFSIVHSVNCCKIRSLETDRARARSNPDRMASYSASLLDAENPSRMACSRCSPVGDCNKSPTPEPDEREAPSTRRVHHSCSLDSWLLGVFVNIRARSRPLLGLFWIIWVGIRFQIRSIRWPIVAFAQLNLVCAECYEGVGRQQSLGGLENRGGAFGQHFEELRLLAPFLNTWFLHLPMPC